jgi:serine/threonine-protein phosphatase PGAM5
MKKTVAEAPPTRVLHFVRHGQYHRGDTATGTLTELGKRQAAFIARHFRGQVIDSLVSSDMPRAVQTADILGNELGIRRIRRHPLLREVLPTPVPGMKVGRETRIFDANRVELIVTRFFKPSRTTRHEIVVCHGNLIRALVIRLATGRLTGWYRLFTHHGGVTSFVVAPKGIAILDFNVHEHIPRKLRTEW